MTEKLTRSKSILLVIFFITILISSSVHAQPNIEDQIRRVENGLRRNWSDLPWEKKMNLVDRMNYYNVPGVSITFIDNFEISWTKTYGTKKVDTNDPVTEETLFQAASISKPVTAIMVLYYVQESILDLDAHGNDYLTEWKIPENTYTADNQVTIRQLLSHTAGLMEYTLPGYTSEPYPSLSQILMGEPPANTPPIQVVMPPGEQYVYSNFGYVILQQLLEDIRNEPFETQANGLILEKLGMTSSSFSQPLEESQEISAAFGHRSNGVMLAERWRVYPEQSAAGLWTTSKDLAKFVIEIMLSKHDESNKILSQNMIETMFSEPLEDSGGLGLGIEDEGSDLKYFLHKGANEGFKGIFVGYYELGQGVIILTNSDNGDLFYDEVMKSISFEYGWVREGFSFSQGLLYLVGLCILLYVVRKVRYARARKSKAKYTSPSRARNLSNR
jgi:CubicO group peptidase (beta-lactamase class C family)